MQFVEYVEIMYTKAVTSNSEIAAFNLISLTTFKSYLSGMTAI